MIAGDHAIQSVVVEVSVIVVDVLEEMTTTDYQLHCHRLRMVTRVVRGVEWVGCCVLVNSWVAPLHQSVVNRKNFNKMRTRSLNMQHVTLPVEYLTTIAHT